jgi:hypothetical protein
MRVKSKAAEMSASGALMKGRGQDGVACSPVSVSIVEDAGARSGRTRATSCDSMRAVASVHALESKQAPATEPALTFCVSGEPIHDCFQVGVMKNNARSLRQNRKTPIRQHFCPLVGPQVQFPEIVQMMEHHVGRTASPGVLSAGPTNVVTTRFTTVYESVHLPSNFNAAFSRGGVWATR